MGSSIHSLFSQTCTTCLRRRGCEWPLFFANYNDEDNLPINHNFSAFKSMHLKKEFILYSSVKENKKYDKPTGKYTFQPQPYTVDSLAKTARAWAVSTNVFSNYDLHIENVGSRCPIPSGGLSGRPIPPYWPPYAW